MKSNYIYSTISLLAPLLLIAGCRVAPKYHVPSAMATAPPVTYKESPMQFADSDGWKVAQPQDAMLRGKWWEIYNDAGLNALEERLNIDNQTINQYFENCMEARTLIAQAHSQLYPTVGTAPSYQPSLSSGNLRNTTGTARSTIGTSTGTTGAVTNSGQQGTIESLSFESRGNPIYGGKSATRFASINTRLR
jgi:outer membrane protein TolC